jgi:hypothetical protein
VRGRIATRKCGGFRSGGVSRRVGPVLSGTGATTVAPLAADW